MQNRIKKLLTSAVLSLSAVALLLLFNAAQVMAAAVTLSGNAATNATTNLDASSMASGVDTLILGSNHTLTIATTPFTIAATGGVSSGVSIASAGTSSFILLDGKSLIVEGTGTASGGAMIFNVGSGSAGTSTLTLNGDTYASQHAIEYLNATDATRINIVNMGDGTGTTTFAGVIDMSNAAGGKSVLNLNGAIISGIITDNAAADVVEVNVLGDSTLSAANDLASATATTTVTITDAKTLTLGDSLTLGASGKFILGTGAAGGTLKLTGADTYLGLIQGPSDGVGTLDIDAASTITSIVGGSSKALASIDVGAATTFSAAVNSTAFNLSADVKAILTGTLTTTNITVTTTNQGELETAGAITIAGAVGASDKLLKLLDVDHTLTTSSTVHATTIDTAAVTHTANGKITAAYNFSADGTLTLGDGVDVTGAITATTSDNGNILTGGPLWSVIDGNIGVVGNLLNLVDILAADKLEVTGNVLATDTNIAAAGEIKFSNAANAAALTKLTCAAACVVDIGSVTVSASGTVLMNNSGSTLKVTIGETDGTLTGAGTVTGHTGNTLVPTIKGAVVSGESLTIITGNAAQAVPGTITDNYERYNFAAAQCNTNDLCLTATVVAPAGVTGDALKVSAIADVAFATDATMTDAINGLSGAVLNKALGTLTPEVDGGAIVGAVSAGGAASNTISTQMASLRSGIAAGQGINAGDGSNDKRFWAQGFGTYAEQQTRQSINGFSSSTGGMAFGLDKRVLNNLLIGGAYSYAYTAVDGSLSKNTTDIQSHQGTVYGSYDLDRSLVGDGAFLDGQVSYAYNDYSGNRHINVGAVERQAKSDYDGYQIGTKLELGKTINLNDFRFTPSLGLSYTRVEIHDYTETRATTSNLTVAEQDYDILNNTLKAKVARTWQVNGLDLTPEVHVGYSYEYLHQKIQATSNFGTAATNFTSIGFSPANHTYLGGLGMTYKGVTFDGNDGLAGLPPVDFTLTYDFAAKDHFMSHSALLKGTWRF